MVPPTDTAAGTDTAGQDPARDDDELVEVDLLIEEISIDGMCGFTDQLLPKIGTGSPQDRTVTVGPSRGDAPRKASPE